jgi:hypothetical protein
MRNHLEAVRTDDPVALCSRYIAGAGVGLHSDDDFNAGHALLASISFGGVAWMYLVNDRLQAFPVRLATRTAVLFSSRILYLVGGADVPRMNVTFRFVQREAPLQSRDMH